MPGKDSGRTSCDITKPHRHYQKAKTRPFTYLCDLTSTTKHLLKVSAASKRNLEDKCEDVVAHFNTEKEKSEHYFDLEIFEITSHHFLRLPGNMFSFLSFSRFVSLHFQKASSPLLESYNLARFTIEIGNFVRQGRFTSACRVDMQVNHNFPIAYTQLFQNKT